LPDDAVLFYVGAPSSHSVDEATIRRWSDENVALRTVLIETKGQPRRGVARPPSDAELACARGERTDVEPAYKLHDESGRRFWPEARIVDGRVDVFYTEGGWEEIGWAVLENDDETTERSWTAHDVRRAIGSAWRELTMIDSVGVHLCDIVVSARHDGAFDVHFTAVGDVVALVQKFREKPSRTWFDDDGCRAKAISLTWSAGGRAPRDWLREELARIALEPGSEPWSF
jgi:hypothetical protein